MSTSTENFCSYRYSGLDLLTAIERDGKLTQRLYAGEHLAAEYRGKDDGDSVFQHGNLLLALQMRKGDKVESQLLITDQQRSVLRLVDPESAVRQVYTAYGHRQVERGPGSLQGFNGEAVDPVTGHYLLGNGHRAFNPVLMRFNGPDRLSPFDRGGLNAYAYCRGDPVNFIDPTGREAWQTWLPVALSLLGIASAGIGLFSSGLSIAASKTASTAASVSMSKMSTYAGLAGAVSGLVGAGVGATRSIMNVKDPVSPAQDPLLITMAALSVLSFAFSGASVAYKFRAHKLNRTGALDVAYSGPKPGNRRNPLAKPDATAPSAPPLSAPPTPRSPQASAPFPTPPPIGFERFVFPPSHPGSKPLIAPPSGQPRFVKNAKSIRRH